MKGTFVRVWAVINISGGWHSHIERFSESFWQIFYNWGLRYRNISTTFFSHFSSSFAWNQFWGILKLSMVDGWVVVVLLIIAVDLLWIHKIEIQGYETKRENNPWKCIWWKFGKMSQFYKDWVRKFWYGPLENKK